MRSIHSVVTVGPPTRSEHCRKYVAGADRPYLLAVVRRYVRLATLGYNVAPVGTALDDHNFYTLIKECHGGLDMFIATPQINHLGTISYDCHVICMTTVRRERFRIER